MCRKSSLSENPPFGEYSSSKILFKLKCGVVFIIFMKKGGGEMKITNVLAAEDYKLLIDFEEENQVLFNMQRMVQTIPYLRLTDPEIFKAVRFEDKAIYWDAPEGKPECMPIRLTVDSILFTLR
jgi:hypothetical protein